MPRPLQQYHERLRETILLRLNGHNFSLRCSDASSSFAGVVNELKNLLRALEMLVGILSLGLAILLLRQESKRNGRPEDMEHVQFFLTMTVRGAPLIMFRKVPESLLRTAG